MRGPEHSAEGGNTLDVGDPCAAAVYLAGKQRRFSDGGAQTLWLEGSDNGQWSGNNAGTERLLLQLALRVKSKNVQELQSGEEELNDHVDQQPAIITRYQNDWEHVQQEISNMQMVLENQQEQEAKREDKILKLEQELATYTSLAAENNRLMGEQGTAVDVHQGTAEGLQTKAI